MAALLATTIGIGSVLAIVWAAAVFQVGVLMQGKPVPIELLRWIRRA